VSNLNIDTIEITINGTLVYLTVDNFIFDNPTSPTTLASGDIAVVVNKSEPNGSLLLFLF